MQSLSVFFLSALLIFSGCTFSVDPSTLDKSKAITDINKIMDNWHDAAADADLEKYMGAMDSASIYIGTDASENWSKEAFKEFCKPYFDKKKTWDFTPLERNVYVNEQCSTAWFDELLKTHMGTCRGSGALEFIKGSWKIKHYVLSLTIPNDDIDAVKLAKKKNDDAFLDAFK